jgi:hypothetical protein
MSQLRALAIVAVLCTVARADVVVNEILFNPPDMFEDIQFLELHNTADKPVAVAGWKLTKGVKYEFPAKARIDANGFLVLCKDAKAFKKHYGFDAAGQFTGALRRNTGEIGLTDATGKKIDSVKYSNRAPWPLSADGYSSSLERICPTAPGTTADNWAPSPMSVGVRRPEGTPGKKNTNYAALLPPVITNVTCTPKHAGPKDSITVEAEVRSTIELRSVELLHRLAGSGYEKSEASIPMTRSPKGRYTATIPAQKVGQIVRFRIKATDTKNASRVYPNENDVRPAFSVYVHDPFEMGKVPFGLIVNIGKAEFNNRMRIGGRFYGAPPSPAPPARGNSAFVYVDQKTGTSELFDFVTISARSAGRKVRFHKDHPLNGMSSINLIYEYNDRFVVAEPLSFELYRKAGNAAPRTDFVRTWIDGQPIGFQLLIEQPNKSFLRHNKMRTDGDLFKLAWFGQGLLGQHEQKSYTGNGHTNLVKLVDELGKTKGEKQWEVIKKNFDVEQVINYFAVNMLLSHWDGYFNNYFTYHDVKGTGKWTMYPWDQDKAWGYHDGLGAHNVFYDMPITFGMEGDRPPGYPKFLPAPTGFGFNAWWRPGGHFSKPLLANPQFRKLFLARTKELAEKVYTEEAMNPLIMAVGERLEDEVHIRAKLHGGDPKQASAELKKNLDVLREHVVKRRKFLLEQDEIKKAGKFDRTELK